MYHQSIIDMQYQYINLTKMFFNWIHFAWGLFKYNNES
jgi:hypothetical protein